MFENLYSTKTIHFKFLVRIINFIILIFIFYNTIIPIIIHFIFFIIFLSIFNCSKNLRK